MSNPKFSFETTAEEVADAFASEIKGKNVLVTGTSLNGIGFETARAIAKYANLVVITGYNEERLRLTEEAIKKDLPAANIRRLKLDLSSFAHIRKAAAEVNAYSEPIHVLIHNAAAAIGSWKLTVDGLESQVGTSHVGSFLLTKLLAPKLLASASETYTPRVVWVSSGAHAFGKGVDLEQLKAPKQEKYNSGDAYVQAKSANILAAIGLTRRAKGKIHGYSLHPGIIVTNIGTRDEARPVMISMGIFTEDGKPNTEKFQFKTIPQGAATTVAAAFNPAISATPGAYLNDSAVANDQVAPHSSDPEIADKLWAVTEDIIGEKFEF